MTFTKALAFASVVTLAGMALDIMAHLLTGVTVHFNYVSEKTFIVGLALLFFTWWIGADRKNGALFVFLASALFYVYYFFAQPTLDRLVFTLDEQIKWVFFHFIFIYVPYLAALAFLDGGLIKTSEFQNPKKLFWWLAIGGTVISGLMLLPGIEFIFNNGLVIGRTYNDHVTIAITFLVIGVAAFYKLINVLLRLLAQK